MTNEDSFKSNIPEFSVSELAFSLKKTLEENYGRVRVRGELSRVKIHTSGHLYTDLKDADSVINAVCWKGTLSKLSIRPEEGMEVICTGMITTYPARSNYQLRIDSMELAGQGALLKMLEDRRKRLLEEGLFDQTRKRALPFLPEVIGVVTSPTGAVIRDILHRLNDRFPRQVIVWPVLVQGPGAAEQIAAAINGFQTIHQQGLPRPDVLIIARGGGSLEDLMPFNEEIVVRAAAASTIPLISAVGHETDTTLIDYASDMRAPTPTAAAEMAVPQRAGLLAQVLDDEQRLISGVARMLVEARHKLDARAGALGDPRKLLEVKTQRLDYASDVMARVYKDYLAQKNLKVVSIAAKLRHPKQQIEAANDALNRWSDELKKVSAKVNHDLQIRLSHAEKMLAAYSYKNVLKRGFVVVQDAHGKTITDASLLQSEQEINLIFHDKNVAATINAKK